MHKKSKENQRKEYRVAVVGATGLVGQEMLNVLKDREFPVSKVYAFASKQSAGESISFGDEEIVVQELAEDSFKNNPCDFALFATSAELSSHYVHLAAASGAYAIDNSSYFRMHPEIPLVVPEVNADILQNAKNKIIANPNCSTIQLVVCLKALSRFGLKRVVVSTYQSVSGAGADAMTELEHQISTLFSHGEAKAKVFPHQIAFNCIPQIDSFTENGYTKEELKVIQETRKILAMPQLRITATAVRVPTFNCHAESVNIEFEKPVTPNEARAAMDEEGIMIFDDPSKGLYPLGFALAGRDEVFVGRVRTDESLTHGLNLWIVADNIRKGAATNAVQIAEELTQIAAL